MARAGEPLNAAKSAGMRFNTLSFFMARRPCLKCIHSIFCLPFSQSFFFSFFRSQGLCFATSHLRVTPAAHAHYPRALIRGALRCRGPRLENRVKREEMSAAGLKRSCFGWGRNMSSRRTGSRPIMRCNGPSSCVINRGNNTDTVSECTANSLSDLEDNYSRSAADRP